MNIALYISLISSLFYLVLAVVDSTLFFQQNSYRYRRYFRWLRGDLPIFSFSIYLALALIQLFFPSVASFVVASVFYILGGVIFLRTKHKKGLVATARVRRMWITSIVVLTLGSLFFLELVWFLGALPWAFLLLANFLNIPLERSITRWYINDARRIIRSMPNLRVIGVTGSYGKSSTKGALLQTLSSRYSVLATPGNFNTLLGVVRTIREQLKPYHEVFIVEMGAKQAGDIKEICDVVCPSIGIITSVGEQHLETFGSIEAVQRTKFELIDSLPEDGFALLNGDYPWIANRPVENLSDVVYYGASDSTLLDYRVGESHYRSLATYFRVVDRMGESHEFSTRLLGQGNLLNIMASYIVASHLGISPDKCRAAISQLQAVEHRLSIRSLGDRIILDDAYNSNPVGSKMALDVLREFDTAAYLSLNCTAEQQRIVITPGMVELGSAQYSSNRELGAHIGRSATFAVIVNKVNREAILEGLAQSELPKDRIKVVDSFLEAMDLVNAHFTPASLRGSAMLLLNDLPDTYK